MSEVRKVGEGPSDGSGTKPPASSIKKVPLIQLGNQLPIGIVAPDGNLNKALAVRPWKTKDEREIGKQKARSTADKVPNILARLATQIGPHEWTEDSPKFAEKVVMLSQMFMGDVFYIYVLIRREAMGPVLKLKNLICHACETTFDYQADLNTLEVVTTDRIEDLDWEYELIHPIEIRGKMVGKFQMGALRWGMLDQVNGENESSGKIAAVRGSIVRLNDDDDAVMLTEPELDELSKRDLETLSGLIDEHHAGPDMSVEGVCPKCRTEFMRPIDWRAESFFAISSQ